MAVQFVLLCLHAEYHRILEHGAFAIRLLVDMGLFALYIQCGTLRQDDHFAICSKRVTNSATGPIDIPNTALPRSVVGELSNQHPAIYETKC